LNSKEDTVGQKPRQAPKDVPDSLPKRDEGTDVSPDGVRRTDRPDRAPPDSMPEEKETSPDGGVAQHPIHDADQDDRQPDDFERDVDRDGVLPVDAVLRRQT
jgi:hypothetical protein